KKSQSSPRLTGMATKYFQRTSSCLVCAIICCIQMAASALIGVDELSMHLLAKASSLSYLDMNRMASSSYLKTSKLEPVAQVIDVGSQSGATIFRSSAFAESGENKLIVACRGSANLNNFITNLNFNLVPATQLSQNDVPNNAMVHEGFQTASLGLWNELLKPLREHLDASTTEIIYTGHSLGAATALLCATHFNASFKEIPTLSIVTFGGPRLCNFALASYLRNEALLGCEILHLVHKRDPVLANNQMLWDNLGFKSVGTELECDPYSPTVFTEVEDIPKYPFAWNILDHCNYMVNIWYDTQHAKG
ncbi:hypothetical protein ACHAXA_010050, partial [Cyclostephanos tholiformis]